jgi:hypothetical protein
VQIAYAIGVAQPVGVHVNTFGTGRVADEVLEKYIMRNFDMRPKALIEELDLLKPPDLPQDRGVRALRPQRVLVGEDRARRQDGRRPPLAPIFTRSCA